MKIIRDCKNCEYYVSLDTGNFSTIQGCKKWGCEFKPKESKIKIKLSVTYEELERLSKEELADLIMLRLNKEILELEKQKNEQKNL